MSSARGPVRVLEVIGNAIVGGMETYVERLMVGLAGRGFEFTCLCPFESHLTQRLRGQGWDVHVARLGDEISWPSLQALLAMARLERSDVLHAHLSNAFLLAAVAGRMLGRPVLSTIHGRTLSQLDFELQRQSGAHLSVVHRAGYLNALACGVPRKRLHLVPNGVDVRQFRPLARTPQLHARLGIAHDTPLVGLVARLSPEKGPDLFVRAAALARDAGCPAHFVLIGEGPMRDTLAQSIRRLRLSDSVHLAGACTDMPRVLASLAVVVSASHSEGMPLAVMEAMACERPVIATSVGGNLDLIEVGRTGYLVAPGDAQAIADLAAMLVASDPLRSALGRAARQRVETAFSFDTTLEGMDSLLRRLAGRAPPAVRAVMPVAAAHGGRPQRATDA